MKKLLKMIFVLALFVQAGCNAESKIIDPNHPNFDPLQFKFEDYADPEEAGFSKHDVFKVIFPIGTPKSYIDKILIDGAGAEINTVSSNEKRTIYYKNKVWNLSSYRVYLYFDQDSKLINIGAGYIDLYYPDKVEKSN